MSYHCILTGVHSFFCGWWRALKWKNNLFFSFRSTYIDLPSRDRKGNKEHVHYWLFQLLHCPSQVLVHRQCSWPKSSIGQITGITASQMPSNTEFPPQPEYLQAVPGSAVLCGWTEGRLQAIWQVCVSKPASDCCLTQQITAIKLSTWWQYNATYRHNLHVSQQQQL